MTNGANIEHACSHCSALGDRLDAIEQLLGELCRAQGVKRPDPRFISLKKAAAMLGLDGRDPTGALRKRIREVNRKDDGPFIRRRHGAVHRQDFEQYIEWLETKKKPVALAARDVVEAISS